MSWTSPYRTNDTSSTWKDVESSEWTQRSFDNPPEELVDWLPEDGFDEEETGS